MSRGPRFVMLGKQGSGKGTQATRLAEHFGIVRIATGDMFRAAARGDSPLGVEAKRYMDAGDLVPDRVTIGMVEARLASGGLLERGFILDGFPRNEAQARELERILSGHDLDAAIDLEVPTDVALARIAGRREAEHRADDTEEAIAHRLELYERQTAPLIGFYTQRGLLVEVDGVGEPDEVFERLVKAVEARLT